MRVIRQSALLITGLFVINSCTKAVDVPRDQFEAESHTIMRAYIIRTAGGEEYEASKFSVTDSTLVIAHLNPSDARHGKATLPISIPLDEVESLRAVDQRETTFWVFIGLGVVVVGVAILKGLAASIGGSS